MKDKIFNKRVRCPSCNSKNNKTIYSCGFLKEPILGYLKDFYKSINYEDLNLLAGEKYILNECENCGLIFQKYIPNDFLMYKIYEK